ARIKTTHDHSVCFPSRRRHTKAKRDRSSDVCCSDLPRRGPRRGGLSGHGGKSRNREGLRKAAGQNGSRKRRCTPRHGNVLVLTRSEERRVGKECRSP